MTSMNRVQEPTARSELLLLQGAPSAPPLLASSTDTLPIKDRKVLSLARRDEHRTPEELAFAKEVRRLETRYVQWRVQRHESFTVPRGESFRSAGALHLRTCRDGVRRFVAYMHEDSFHHDFRYFDRVIDAAKVGRIDGWRQHTYENGDEGWVFDYPNYQIDEISPFKPAAVIIDKLSEDPTMVGFGSSWGLPCEEPRCREKLHEPDDLNHILETLDNNLTKRGGYEIEICKDRQESKGSWHLSFWANGDLTELTPEQIATLANDLQWMGLECATTNAKEMAA